MYARRKLLIHEGAIDLKGRSDIHYFDFAATTFMCEPSIQAYADFQRNISVLWGKGSNELAALSKEIFDEAAASIRKHFRMDENVRLILGKNATELTNIIAMSIEHLVNPMDIILVGPYEHHSNFLPWKYLARRTGALFIEMPLTESGEIDTSYIETISDHVKIVAYSSVANTNGFIVNKHQIDALFGNDTLIFSDESQCVAHAPIETERMVSGYILSSHKMYGPKNIAGAFVRSDLVKKMRPVFLGGGMIDTQQMDDAWASDEYKFYAGTYDVGLLYAWAAACEYLDAISYQNIQAKELADAKRVRAFLAHQDAVTLLSGKQSSASLIAFVHDRIHPHDIENFLAKRHVVIRAGHMCAQNAVRKMGYYAINRISFGLAVTDEDFEALCHALQQCFEEASG